MHAAKLGAIEQARKLCKELIRVDEVTDPDPFTMDDARQVDDLAQLGWTAGRQVWNKVQPLFFADRPKATPLEKSSKPGAAICIRNASSYE